MNFENRAKITFSYKTNNSEIKCHLGVKKVK
jgi:hypothetical protein